MPSLRSVAGHAAASFSQGHEQVLPQHFHIGENGHEVGISGPARDDVEVDVVDDAGTGGAPEIPADVVALRREEPAERLDRSRRQAVDLERLAVVELGEVADMPKRRHEHMADAYGKC